MAEPQVVDPETLNESIVRIAACVSRMKQSGFNKRAIVVLLNDWTGVGKRDIERVLEGLQALPKAYCDRVSAK